MFKFNNGNGAVVCNSCGVIMQTGISFDQYSEKYTGTDLCPVCKLKKIDNFDIICPFLEHLVNKVTFLYIIIVNDKNEIIKNYYVSSNNDLSNIKQDIIKVCKQNHAKAYINIIERSYKEVALACIQELAKKVLHDNVDDAYKIYQQCCHENPSTTGEDYYMVTVNSRDDNIFDSTLEIIKKCKGTITLRVSTPNGYQLVIRPTDVHKFFQLAHMYEIDNIVTINKDPTILLYYNRI